MMFLQTDVGTFGPFLVIEEIEGGWKCDGIIYFTLVVGNAEIIYVNNE